MEYCEDVRQGPRLQLPDLHASRGECQRIATLQGTSEVAIGPSKWPQRLCLREACSMDRNAECRLHPPWDKDSIVRQGALRTPLHVLSGHHRPHPASYWSCRLQTLSAHPRPSAPRRRLLTKRLLGILGIVGKSKGSTTAELFAATCCPHVWISGFRVWHVSVIELLNKGAFFARQLGGHRLQRSTLQPPGHLQCRRAGMFRKCKLSGFQGAPNMPRYITSNLRRITYRHRAYRVASTLQQCVALYQTVLLEQPTTVPHNSTCMTK